MNHTFVVVDLETTGNAPKKGDRIIQVGAVVIENGVITNRFSSLVNPGKEIPPFIESLTGINNEMVKNAPFFKEIAENILSLLEGAFFVAHNVFFDLHFLQEELKQAGLAGFYGPIIDTVELSRILFPSADSYKLSDLAIREGIDHDRPHQADSDAEVTAELLLILQGKLESLPEVTIRKMAELSVGLKSDLHLLFETVLLKKEKTVEVLPSEMEVYRGLAIKKPVEIETYPKMQMAYPETVEDKKALLEKAMPDFELRKGQLEMMDDVHHSLEMGLHAIIEAGTGIGKTLAYLVPAAIFARQQNKTVIVSTYTTQLQQQLLHKEVKNLRDMLGYHVKTALLKGRSHYISLSRFEVSIFEEEDNYDTTLTKMQVLVWLTETETGDSDELNLSSGGMIYWNKIKNDSSVFLQDGIWNKKDFFLRAKKAASEADIVITNHAMLLRDLASDEPFLPYYDHIILDEAHQFEKAAGSYFGEALDHLSIKLLVNQLGLSEQQQVFGKLEDLAGEEALRLGSCSTDELNNLIIQLQQEAEEFFKAAALLARKQTSYRSVKAICLLGEESEIRENQNLHLIAERVAFVANDLIKELKMRLQAVQGMLRELKKTELAVVEEAAALLAELEGIRAKIRNMILFRDPSYVAWIEADLRSPQNHTTITGRPADISPFLKDRFFGKKNSVIMTSATLSVNSTFEYLKRNLGIDEMQIISKIIPSPFEYQSQVKMFVPKDIPEIKAVREEDYIVSISEQIISIAEATKGRMLILFTSHDMLRKTHDLIKESGMLEDFALIAQGITAGSRSRLTRNFQKFEKAILFGTSSFWEGVDIPGEDLSCLIIVRLPFSPPDEPITKAKHARIRNRGGNPFNELSLPEAVLRFKQGFGRLIRTFSDRGVVVVFDRRILTSSYGHVFLDSIPAVPVKEASVGELTAFIDSWL
ncbi:ATP-dependent DNA helicase DinG [Bacillus massilinigeriensis]|uniref:ATP-dependent DNA helicase DinG n=1 Tax=Bacillus mediterraneensis TaxID=1805474 RepID=UPI0008F87CDF|nr:ATP-dependent DNA helicase DinG [Bacillus mediterraneensis]